MSKLVGPSFLLLCLTASAESVIEGSIHKADGSPAAGAIVSATNVAATVLTAPIRPTLSQADDRGRFRLTLPEGTYGVTATLPETAGGFVANVLAHPAGTGPRLRLSLAAGGVRVAGVVRMRSGLLVPGAVVMAGAYGAARGDVFQTIADSRGRWNMSLPIGTYGFRAHKDGVFSACITRGTQTRAKLSLYLKPVLGSTLSDTQVNALRKHTVAVEPSQPPMASATKSDLKSLIGNARVVGIGEATHGTREFQQFQRNIFQFLVTEMGFSAFALEVNWYEALAVNRYVVDGVGDAITALRNLRSWPAATEERLELIRWMRHYNQDPAHRRKITFHGFDMQYPTSSAAVLSSFFEVVDAQYLATVRESLHLLDSYQNMGSYGKLSQDTHERTAAQLSSILKRIGAFESDYVRRSGRKEWLLAKQHGTVLAQAERWLRFTSKPLNPEATSFGIRDRAMAENIMSILTEQPRSKVVVVAHNGHLSTEPYLYGEVESMGMRLRQLLGPDLFIAGCTFGEGTFLSFDRTQRRLRSFSAGPPRTNMLEHLMRTAHISSGVVDLRGAWKDGSMRRWLSSTFLTWSGGSVGPGRIEDMLGRITPRDAFDALTYFDNTTPARPLTSP